MSQADIEKKYAECRRCHSHQPHTFVRTLQERGYPSPQAYQSKWAEYRCDTCGKTDSWTLTEQDYRALEVAP